MQLLATLLLASVLLVVDAQEEVCAEPVSAKSHALLQKPVSAKSPVYLSTARSPSLVQPQREAKTNPSGAAAPLNEEGYSAVADRCCEAEMKVFIERVIFDNDLQVCAESGLLGFIPWHSCGAVQRSFLKLETELLQASTSDCPWVQNKDDACQTLPGPPACLHFPDIPPSSHCQCSRSEAAKVDFAGTSVLHNNLGGWGPDSGVEELRLGGTPSAGTSSTGEPFDIVITTDQPDYKGANLPTKNGLWGPDFGVIYTVAVEDAGVETNFKFSFVKPGTNTPVTLSEIHMTVFDIDGPTNWEVSSSKGYTGYATVPDTNLMASKLPDGRTRFTGTQNMNAANLKALGANRMTDEDKKATVMYFYKNVASFELQFGRTVKGGPSGLLFAFESSLNELCAE